MTTHVNYNINKYKDISFLKTKLWYKAKLWYKTWNNTTKYSSGSNIISNELFFLNRCYYVLLCHQLHPMCVLFMLMMIVLKLQVHWFGFPSKAPSIRLHVFYLQQKCRQRREESRKHWNNNQPPINMDLDQATRNGNMYFGRRTDEWGKNNVGRETFEWIYEV